MENPKLLLFTTDTCPKCPHAKESLKAYIELGIVRVVNATEEPKLAGKYKIRTVPIMIEIDKDENEIRRFTLEKLLTYTQEEGELKND